MSAYLEELWTRAQGGFDGIKTNPTSPILELNGALNLSLLRDGPYNPANSGGGTSPRIGYTEGSAEVNNTESEYELVHTGAGADAVMLRSASRGRYQPGVTAEAGIGMRLDQEPTSGDIDVRWGYMDFSSGAAINNALLFGVDATGRYIARYANGSILDAGQGAGNKVYQEDWNGRKDFFGPNANRDFTDGWIFQVKFNYYGDGLIHWMAVKAETGMEAQRTVRLHSWAPTGETSLPNPNLFLGASITSSTSSTPVKLYVHGRKFEMIGRRSGNNSFCPEEFSTSVDNTWTPLISFKRKDTGFWGRVPVQALGIAIGNSVKRHRIQLRVTTEGSLTGASFGSFSHVPDAETAFQVDTAATDIDMSIGTCIQMVEIPTTGQGANKSGSGRAAGRMKDVPDDLVTSFVAKNVEDSTTNSVDGHATMVQEF